MSGNFVELRVLQRHTADLTTAIKTNPPLFGQHLVTHGFTVQTTVDSKVDVQGIPNYEKASRLLSLVDSVIRTAGSKENARRYFDALLEILDGPMGQTKIVQTLKATHVSMTPRSSQTGQLRGSNSHSRSQHPAFDNADLNRIIDHKHLGRIADSMYEWEGIIADELDLGPADVATIKKGNPTDLKLQTRDALAKWKQKKGDSATYINLIKAFERAGYQQFADNVKRVASEKTSGNGGQEKEGNVAASSGANVGNDDIIEMPNNGEARVDIDSGGFERTQELRWCESPLCEHIRDPGQSHDVGRQMSLASLQENNLWDIPELRVEFMNKIPPGWAFSSGRWNLHSIMGLANKWKRDHIPRLKPVKENGDIRVCFTDKDNSQSKVGVRAQDELAEEPTMLLNLSQGGDQYKEYLVVHEFGHALGLDHEHQRGDFWKLIEPYVDDSAMRKDPLIRGAYARYIADPTFGASDRKTTKYDPSSVMHYWFRSCWLKKNFNTEGKVKKANISADAKAALLGILQRSKGTLVTEPSQKDLDFLDDCYKKKKESKKNDTDNGRATHAEEGPAQPPTVQVKEGPVPQNPAEEDPAPQQNRKWGTYLLIIGAIFCKGLLNFIGNIWKMGKDYPLIMLLFGFFLAYVTMKLIP